MTTPSTPPCPCGHSLGEHDAIASRYCRATAFSEPARGCVCKPPVAQPQRASVL